MNERKTIILVTVVTFVVTAMLVALLSNHKQNQNRITSIYKRMQNSQTAQILFGSVPEAKKENADPK